METTSGKRPSSIGNPNSQCQDRATIRKIIDSYKDHPNVATITENILPLSLSFDLPPASKKDINEIVKSLNANKATELYEIPLKLLNFLPILLTNILLIS